MTGFSVEFVITEKGNAVTIMFDLIQPFEEGATVNTINFYFHFLFHYLFEINK